MGFKEENIWHIISKKALTKSKIITNIYVNEKYNVLFSKTLANEDEQEHVKIIYIMNEVKKIHSYIEDVPNEEYKNIKLLTLYYYINI